MADYSITFARSARKELEKLPTSMIPRIVEHIDELAKAPRPPGSKKLKGGSDLWRFRVGDYRIIYSINDANQIVDISAIRHRSDAYRDM